MAITKHDIVKFQNRNEAVLFEKPQALGDGIALKFTGDDNKIFILANDGDATIKAGNSVFAGPDLELDDGCGVVIDSGRFKNVSGDYKDHIMITGATGTLITAVELP